MSATASVPAPAQAAPATKVLSGNDLLFVQLAREIAMDIHPLDHILKTHDVTEIRWAEIQNSPHFVRLLQSAVEEWNSALNTAERVKLKALSCLEESLPEFYARMHDPREALPAKVRAFEVFGNIAGLSKNGQVAGGGERFNVTINLGADKQLKISAPQPDMIDVSDK